MYIKPFRNKLFKTLLYIQVVILFTWFFLFSKLIFEMESKKGPTLSEWYQIIAIFIYPLVCAGNLLYNFYLLRAYNAPPESKISFKKAGSIILLCLYIPLIALSIYGSYMLISELRTMYSLHHVKLGLKQFLVVSSIILFGVTGIWMVVMQIKLLRLLKYTQLAKADELLAQLGADSEIPR